MKVKSKNTVPQFPLKGSEIEGCRNSVGWTHRALGTGVAILGMTDAELTEAMHDDDRMYLICQILKTLFVDKRYAQTQAHMRKLAIDRIARALVDRNHPDTEQLVKSEIDFEILPPVPDLTADFVNALRP